MTTPTITKTTCLICKQTVVFLSYDCQHWAHWDIPDDGHKPEPDLRKDVLT